MEYQVNNSSNQRFCTGRAIFNHFQQILRVHSNWFDCLFNASECDLHFFYKTWQNRKENPLNFCPRAGINRSELMQQRWILWEQWEEEEKARPNQRLVPWHFLAQFLHLPLQSAIGVPEHTGSGWLDQQFGHFHQEGAHIQTEKVKLVELFDGFDALKFKK